MWEEMGWDEKSWDEVRRAHMIWDEMKCRVRKVQVWSAKCRVWRVQCEVWGKFSLGIALHPGSRAGHVLGQQHCSSFAKHARTGLAGARRMQVLEVVLGSDSWKLRWHMRRGEMRRDELGQGEKSSDEMKSAVWRVKCEVWSVKCEVRRKQWEVRSVKCGLWSVKCGVWSVKCGVLRMQCEVKRGMRRKQCEVWVWSVKCGVWRVQWEVWSEKWSFKCDMWNRTPLSQNARTHGPGWRMAHASSIDEKRSYSISLRQLPPASCGYYWYSTLLIFQP